jgi:hypothetical protein
VAHGALYLCAYNGQDCRWYQAVLRQRAERVIAAGMTKEVTFEPIDGSRVRLSWPVKTMAQSIRSADLTGRGGTQPVTL